MSISSRVHRGTAEPRSTDERHDPQDQGNQRRLATTASASTRPTPPRAVQAPGFGLTITGLGVLGVVLLLGGIFVVVTALPPALGDVVVGGVLMVSGFNSMLAATVIAVLRGR